MAGIEKGNYRGTARKIEDSLKSQCSEISVIFFSYLTFLLNLSHCFPKWGREEEREYNRFTRFKNTILSTGLTEKESMI